nr:unnamed protein product [Digitaria exilis]
MNVVQAAAVLAAAAALALLLPGWAAAEWTLTKKGSIVTYDGRSLMIDGKRDLFFSGAIHYPRSPPELWPKLIKRAKEGGLNTIETYVFWNAHEPEPGKYNFEGRLDLIKYLKMIQDHDMYAIVRIGPFIQAEWNHGGLPYWLREIGHIIFRANNEPFKKEMEKFVRFIVQKLKDADLFASQGGPVILAQVHRFRAFGDQLAMRSAEDIAYAVLRFFAKGGSMVNYYMYHGGTNFGRTGASYVLTGYYDEAPMDEYGMCKEPKFGHLRDLHNVIRSYQKAFLTGEHSSEKLGHGYEAHTFELPEENMCLSFLSNNNTGEDGTVVFRGEKHYVPSRSVSILAGCKNVVYNTKRVKSTAHSMIGFANDAFVGSGRGSKQVKGFMFEKPVDLKVGVNHITLLSSTMGMKDSGGELAEVKGGIQECLVQGLNTGTLDLQVNGWGHKAALEGEDKEIYSEKGMDKVQWKPAENDRAATWYKRYFDEPDGDDPVVLDMSSMSKGMIFVNGEGMGRYWTSFRSLAGTPSQATYYIPRPFLKSKDNLLVVFEEELGKPDGILIQTVTRDDICVLLSEHNPAQIKTWDTDGDTIKLIAEDHSTRGTLSCPPEKTIQEVVFASFGNPEGMCGNFTVGTCHTPDAKQVVEKECLGKPSCLLPVSHTVYGADINCPSTTATLGVQVRCSSEKKGA